MQRITRLYEMVKAYILYTVTVKRQKPKMMLAKTETPALTAIFQVSQPEFKYTETGIKRLSLAIQATLHIRGWSGRELSRKAKIAPATGSRYINGYLTEPQEHVLRSLAPFIYKVIDFKGEDKVEVNPNETYEDWKEFAKIATEEVNRVLDMDKLISLILDEMQRLGVNESEFAKRALLSPSVLRQILQGKIPGNIEDKLGLLSTVLTNPDTGIKFTGPVELGEYCNMIKKTTCDDSKWEDLHVHT